VAELEDELLVKTDELAMLKADWDGSEGQHAVTCSERADSGSDEG